MNERVQVAFSISVGRRLGMLWCGVVWRGVVWCGLVWIPAIGHQRRSALRWPILGYGLSLVIAVELACIFGPRRYIISLESRDLHLRTISCEVPSTCVPTSLSVTWTWSRPPGRVQSSAKQREAEQTKHARAMRCTLALL